MECPFQNLDPDGEFLSTWNRVFLALCIISLFIDPLYFYIAYAGGPACISMHHKLFVTVTIFRCISDLLYIIRIIFKFRTGFILPGSTVVGRGELVMDPREIANHYLRSGFPLDLAAALPLPQMVQIWIVPSLYYIDTYQHINDAFALIVLIQYVPRLSIIFILTRRIMENSGFVIKTALVGAAYNFLLYMLSSHIFGAVWYLLAIRRQYSCWKSECARDRMKYFPCNDRFLSCKNLGNKDRENWLGATSTILKCNGTKGSQFKYGIYSDALTNNIFSTKFSQTFLYSFWWGLKQLSSFGQNLDTSGYIPEAAFCIFLCIVGLLLFCFLIANIQMYIQSMETKFEKWRDKMKGTKKWMRNRQLPLDLQERITKFGHFEWLVTKGIDGSAITRSLPHYFRRGITRHLCLHLIHHVHFFSKMDNHLLDAICECLVTSLNIADTYIVHEGDPVDEIIFIVKGKLKSSTTDGGRSGFFNSVLVGPGDYCGEELLTWALMPNPSDVLPSSTRTVLTLSDVEAVALRADDLKNLATQFKHLHSKEIQHIFRFYSHQWRTWGACHIQTAWKMFKKKKLLQELRRCESLNNPDHNYSAAGDYEYSLEEMTDEQARTNWAWV